MWHKIENPAALAQGECPKIKTFTAVARGAGPGQHAESPVSGHYADACFLPPSKCATVGA